MNSSERGDLAIRASTLLVLSATMFGLLVWYGSIAGGRSVAVSILDALPDVADLFSIFARTLGTAGGASTATGLSAVGTAPTASSLASLLELSPVPLSSHRAHWEVQYMYGVSALAGTWVLVRLCLGWRFDLGSLAVVPRSEPEDRDA